MWTLKTGQKAQPIPEAIVLRASDFVAISTAKQIVLDGQKEAERIIAEAKAKAEAMIEQAKRDHEAEKKKGFEAGFDEGKQEMANQMMALVRKNVDAFGGFEENIINLVMRIIKRILGEVGQENVIRHVVHNSLQLIRNQQQATIKVHPSQAATVRSAVDEFLKSNSGMQYLDVIVDPRLDCDSCVLETELGVMDSSLNVQLEAVRKALEKSLDG